MAREAFVAYIHVSMDRQGKWGLGLEGHRAAVTQHVDGAGKSIAEYTEVETGKRDSLDNVPSSVVPLHTDHTRHWSSKEVDRLTRWWP